MRRERPCCEHQIITLSWKISHVPLHPPSPDLPTGMQYGCVANSGASSASAPTSGLAAAPSSSSSDDDEEEDEEAGLLWLFPCPPSPLC